MALNWKQEGPARVRVKGIKSQTGKGVSPSPAGTKGALGGWDEEANSLYCCSFSVYSESELCRCFLEGQGGGEA